MLTSISYKTTELTIATKKHYVQNAYNIHLFKLEKTYTGIYLNIPMTISC